MKGKHPLETLVSLSKGNVSRMANPRSACSILISILAVMYIGHRYAAYRMNTVKLYKSPINDIYRECAKPDYEMIDPNSVPANKICITTLTDAKKADTMQRLLRWRNFNSLLEMTWPNKKAYAKKHGYSLFDESDSLDTTRPPSWSKIRAAQRLFKEEDCEWVVWLDADTVVMNSQKRIQDFLPRDKDMLLTVQKGGSYNAGAWVVRKTDWSLKFLDHWWNMDDFVQPKGLSTSGDNAALKSYLLEMDKAEFDEHIGVPARCTFNSVTVFLTPEEYEVAKKLPAEKQEWYMHHEKYHKGDLIAHVAGKNNKIDTTKMLLKDVV
eukprot:CAMPEP_0168751266 /NCGR_PEP_ID=MMETSP0724-20121128/17732_1 /TAXON_ID=265536 /ORGANISM="Amphiprora sp., Strain CCMP467" /LENGTH=322 /DNA_ID=CAMNT_0008799379 /DNA_START=8 /DNA_END=976 /DNA_ORIENTATION=-